MATDFFQRQDVARRNTTLLVFLFGAAVLAIIVSVDLLAALLLGYFSPDTRTGVLEVAAPLVLDPRVVLIAVGGTLLVVVGGTTYKLFGLRGGGRVVAEELGGRRLNANTTTASERQLLNVVEEMAIASGMSTPPVYLLEQENGINAFAAGFTPDDAVIGVTRGTAERLSRDELQGVIAHEFSHILNGDMRLNIRLIGLLHGILIIGLIGHFVFRVAAYSGMGRRRSKDSSPIPLIGLGVGLMVIGFAGSFFGSMIKAAVSRQREFLADASAVQFTRNPGGIADALKKIGGFSTGAALDSPNAPEASHMLFGQGVSGLSSVFATHPPLPDRISRLDPGWDGKFLASTAPPPSARTSQSGVVSGFAGQSDLGQAVADVGQPSDVHLAYASQLVEHMPELLVSAAHEPYGARALIYALLIDRQPEPRERQLAHLAERADSGVFEETKRMILPTARLDPRARLPLVEMSMPALDLLTPQQSASFTANVQVLIEADDQIQLFEWALQRILVRHLDARHAGVRRGGGKQRTLSSLAPQCVTALSMLAWVGHPGESTAQHAFDLGWGVLGLPQQRLLSIDRVGFAQLDAALADLDHARPAAKRKVLDAAAACIGSDLTVTVHEAELLRAFASSLSCPMPPLVGMQAE